MGLPGSRLRAALWALRIVWALQVLTLGPAIGGALEDQSRAVQVAGSVGAWLAWFVALLVALVPTTSTLTVVRMVVPGSVLVALACGPAGASVATSVVALAGSLVVTLLVLGGEVGQAFVQGSAYGDETRLPLRPPGPLLLGPIPVLWLAMATSVVAGPMMLAAQAWALGAVVTLLAIGLVGLGFSRLHRLARRWLVFVPAGLVVHDGIVLAETVMYPRAQIGEISLALADTQAADLTGNALGPAVEVRLAAPGTVVLAPTPQAPAGTALHVQSFLVSPTRPGRAIAEAKRRLTAR
jgi:hypothetical protein